MAVVKSAFNIGEGNRTVACPVCDIKRMDKKQSCSFRCIRYEQLFT
ncbi:MAG: hypothetical protein IJ088_15045 [Clostridia bacterium]|nr:hypothetical protein [Clostridia bacterium]